MRVNKRPYGYEEQTMFAIMAQILLIGFGLVTTGWTQTDFFPEETQLKTAFTNTPIDVCGRVVDQNGFPVENCIVCLTCGVATSTRADGKFILSNAIRTNQLITVTAVGFYPEIIPVELYLPTNRLTVELPPIILWPSNGNVIRFLFGGDTAFARRMLDPLEQAARNEFPVENPDALISVSNPLPGTLRVVSYVKPFFLSVDYPIINFESVVTLDPSTPHWEKDYVYFTLPGSLPALKTLNIDYVGLGNNHVYDYLESGVSNTIYYFNQVGINFSGLGTNSESAFTPFRKTIKGIPCSFLAMTTIGGEQHSITYYATSNKGGAAYLEFTNEAIQAITAEKLAGYLTIVQAHVGYEYTYEPLPQTLRWFYLCADAGADLVIGHHPHVAQGFELYKGVIIAHSLGNLFFDQLRLETMLGLLVVVDMQGNQVRQVCGVPVYIEDYQAKPMCGSIRSVFLRRIGEFSRNVRVFPYADRAWISKNLDQYTFTDRYIEIPVVIGTNKWNVVDLRTISLPEEALYCVTANTIGLNIRPGRDQMWFGDFEDVDVDDIQGEASRWYYGSQSTLSLRFPFRGISSLCMRRSSSTNITTAVMFRNRIRVMGDAINKPNKDISLLGYLKGENAGKLTIIAEYWASEGSNTFGRELAYEHPGGTFNWVQFTSDLHMPPDDPEMTGDPATNAPRALRLTISHHPPATGVGYYWLDELAIINWEENLNPMCKPILKTPHERNFLRVEGEPGVYKLGLTFRSYRPIQADCGHGPHFSFETMSLDQSTEKIVFKPTAVGLSDTQCIVIHNRGNQVLIISNPVIYPPEANMFRIRWLTMQGSEINTPDLSVPPNSRAMIEFQYSPISMGEHQATIELHSNDPDHTDAKRIIYVTGTAYADVPVRKITNLPNGAVQVLIQVPSTISITSTSNLMLEDNFSPGPTVKNVSNDGLVVPESQKIVWGNVVPNSALSYELHATNIQLVSFDGMLRYGTTNLPIMGESTTIVGPPNDTDSDGLPDWWEFKFFDSITQANPGEDPDLDGFNNFLEFVGGSHPFDPMSQPRITPTVTLAFQGTNLLQLTVTGPKIGSYAIEQSQDLSHWILLTSNLPAGAKILLPFDVSLKEAKFFRAILQVQP